MIFYHINFTNGFFIKFFPKDDDDDDDEEEEQTIVRHKTRNTDGSNKDKNLESELLIEPKSEYEDGNDDAVEDLTMADEELMEDLEQAGPSHGGEGSSQGKHPNPIRDFDWNIWWNFYRIV